MRPVSTERVSFHQHPVKTVLVNAVSGEGKPNSMVADWHMRTSFNPPLYAVSIGKTRYTRQLISESKEFVVCFPSMEMEKEVRFCGSVSGRKVDKFKETGLTAIKGRFVRAPLIKEAIANLECKAVQEIETGDHTIFVGEVLQVWESEKEKEALLDVGKGKFSAVQPKN